MADWGGVRSHPRYGIGYFMRSHRGLMGTRVSIINSKQRGVGHQPPNLSDNVLAVAGSL